MLRFSLFVDRGNVLIRLVALVVGAVCSGGIVCENANAQSDKEKIPCKRVEKNAKPKNLVVADLDQSGGFASLATFFQYRFGDKFSEKKVVESFLKTNGAPKKLPKGFGASFYDLQETARKLKYQAVTVKTQLHQLILKFDRAWP